MVRQKDSGRVERGGVAQWIGRRISDQGVPGSIPRRCTFRCGLEQVTFTLCLVPRKRWSDDRLGQTVTRLEITLPNVLSPRDLVSRPDIMDETVPHTQVGWESAKSAQNIGSQLKLDFRIIAFLKQTSKHLIRFGGLYFVCLPWNGNLKTLH